jgi:hypothetical protein
MLSILSFCFTRGSVIHRIQFLTLLQNHQIITHLLNLLILTLLMARCLYNAISFHSHRFKDISVMLDLVHDLVQRLYKLALTQL